MGNTTLLYLIIITTGYSQVVLLCSSVQPPSPSDSNSSSSSSSSGMSDLQVVPLQYCIINNCTIMRIDTGETLNIVYTTDILMVVTPTDGHTSTVVPKTNTALACLISDDNDGQITEIVLRLVPSILLAMVSSYIVFVHLFV